MDSKYLGDIADIITGPFGSALHKSDYVEDGIPCIMPQDIENRTLNLTNIARVGENDVERLSKYKVEEHDIVYARRGDVEKHAFINKNQVGYLCGTGCLRVRITSEDVLPEYVSFYLNTPESRKWISQHAVGSNMPNLNTQILSEVPIKFPSLEKQKEIISCLANIENKMENSRKEIDILLNSIQLIYNYWFVQFEFPNDNNKPYKSNGGMMEWNESLNRNIPKGWNVRPALSLFDWIGTSQPPKSTFIYEMKEGYVRFIQNRDYDSDAYLTYIPLTNSVKTCDEYDIMVDKYGDAGRTRFGIKGAYNVALSKIAVHELIYKEFIRAYLSSEEIYKYLHASCMASTRASLNETNFSFLEICVPSNEVLEKFNSISRKIIEYILTCRKEIRRLEALRDFILPLFMNEKVNI